MLLHLWWVEWLLIKLLRANFSVLSPSFKRSSVETQIITCGIRLKCTSQRLVPMTSSSRTGPKKMSSTSTAMLWRSCATTTNLSYHPHLRCLRTPIRSSWTSQQWAASEWTVIASEQLITPTYRLLIKRAMLIAKKALSPWVIQKRAATVPAALTWMVLSTWQGWWMSEPSPKICRDTRIAISNIIYPSIWKGHRTWL